ECVASTIEMPVWAAHRRMASMSCRMAYGCSPFSISSLATAPAVPMEAQAGRWGSAMSQPFAAKEVELRTSGEGATMRPETVCPAISKAGDELDALPRRNLDPASQPLDHVLTARDIERDVSRIRCFERGVRHGLESRLEELA